MSAAEGVVLPMPMSPVTRQSTPSATRRRATCTPTSRACAASSEVMAGSIARFPVPGRTLAATKSPTGPAGDRVGVARGTGLALPGMGVATPASTTTTARADLASQHVDRRAAGEEVCDHLGCDLRWPRRDALDEHAVVACEDHHGRITRNRRGNPAGDGSELGPELLEAAERPGRFGQSRLALICLDGCGASTGLRRRAASTQSLVNTRTRRPARARRFEVRRRQRGRSAPSRAASCEAPDSNCAASLVTGTASRPGWATGSCWPAGTGPAPAARCPNRKRLNKKYRPVQMQA